MASKIIFSVLVVFLLGSCGTPSREGSGTPTTAFPVTATLPIPPTLLPSETLLPPPPQPTNAPIEGTTSSQVNIRAEPSTASNILGLIPASTKVEILGKDPGGNWFQIHYDQGTDGKGWVTAKYVTTANGTDVPVVGAGGTSPNHSNVVIVQQQINVRSGPGTSFNSLGTLNAQDVVSLIGKDENGAWLQVEFAAGTDGKGWVNAAFVQAKGVENVPIVAEAGDVIGTSTPTGIPPTPTPTIIPAWMDNDSQNNPVANVVFQPFGTQALIYSGDVSTPQGDSDDWIQFTPDRDAILASLECTNENLQVHFIENGQPIAFTLTCGEEMKKLQVKAGSVYSVQLQAPRSTGGLQYIHYRIKIEMGE